MNPLSTKDCLKATLTMRDSCQEQAHLYTMAALRILAQMIKVKLKEQQNAWD